MFEISRVDSITDKHELMICKPFEIQIKKQHTHLVSVLIRENIPRPSLYDQRSCESWDLIESETIAPTFT